MMGATSSAFSIWEYNGTHPYAHSLANQIFARVSTMRQKSVTRIYYGFRDQPYNIPNHPHALRKRRQIFRAKFCVCQTLLPYAAPNYQRVAGLPCYQNLLPWRIDMNMHPCYLESMNTHNIIVHRGECTVSTCRCLSYRNKFTEFNPDV